MDMQNKYKRIMKEQQSGENKRVKDELEKIYLKSKKEGVDVNEMKSGSNIIILIIGLLITVIVVAIIVLSPHTVTYILVFIFFAPIYYKLFLFNKLAKDVINKINY